MRYKILLVDDEMDILQMVKDYLELEGYLVYTASNGKEALEKISILPDLILLDINLPDFDGLEVCRRIRNFVDCPIVFLTAKVEERDRVNGLKCGGDDYIVKPFSLAELSARIEAHLRREKRRGEKEELRFCGGFVIRYGERKLYFGEEEIALTKTEFDILELLSMNKGQIFGKEAIYERLWGYEKEGDSSSITEHIRRIRSKMGKFQTASLIETVWGVGYRWIG
ncbi:MAG: response regulator transcription factor [Lachnospiraceae bacterium]|nr:response regulator transcription factor [Robinsoniella sp.]MDY3765349.1 response regulator transcription factor [Lachnospiraceae bacterium]